ncbi:AlpA family transcriptional regulator [Sphingobium sp. BS19]|uniref:helix-turn-helix transcriptional regulator n=1 Tax=Sphingobium sp. BS19 TaxID=3018973 RepID=UPI0022EFCE58|nr:hypothetical protein Sbs19_42860 [Sphingobium sp. BS19]
MHETSPVTERRSRPPAIIIRPRDVMALLCVSRHGLSRMMQDEGFPMPIKLGPRSLGYLKREVDAWLEARMAARS